MIYLKQLEVKPLSSIQTDMWMSSGQKLVIPAAVITEKNRCRVMASGLDREFIELTDTVNLLVPIAL